MKKRKLKFFSLIMSLILVLVSVPMSVVSEEITDEQGDLSITETNNEVVEDRSHQLITDVQDDLIDEQITLQEQTNEVVATTISYDFQQVTDIPDGVYAFEISTLPGYYMSFTNDSVGNLSATYVMSSAMPPTVMGATSLMFKITRVPNTERYIIRLMSNLNLTLNTSSFHVTTKEIPLEDSQVSESDTFNILYHNGAYLIRSVVGGYYICCGTSSYLAPTTQYETTTFSHWKLRGYRSYIEDGVYSFENLGNSGIWASTQNDSYEAGAYIQKKAYDSCPIDSFARGGMFKINRIGTTDQYTIRSMTNNLLAWSIDGYTIVNQDLPTNEADIPDSMKFYIAFDNDGYIIVPCGTMLAVSLIQETDNLNTVSQFNIPNTAKWKCYKYVGPQLSGVDLVGAEDILSIGAIEGNEYDFRVIYWNTDFNIHDLFLAMDSQYSSDASLSWDDLDNSASFALNTFTDICVYVGLYTITNGTTHMYIADNITFNSVVQQGTVYLQNGYSDEYVNVSISQIEEGAPIYQNSFNPEYRYQWQIEHVPGDPGYIRFKSLYTGKYIGINPNNTSQIHQYSTLGDNTLWKFVLLENGSYKIVSKTSGYALAAAGNSPNYGQLLTQRAYTDDEDFGDEWNIVSEVLSYVNYYDTSVLGDSTIINSISEANSFANAVYSRYFDIGMYMDGDASQFHSIVDDCPQGNNSPCNNSTCGSATNCRELHHKNIYAISDQLYYDDREDSHLYVLWTHRPGKYCYTAPDGHHVMSNKVIAEVCNKRPIIQFYQTNTDNDDYLYLMGIILVHETAHTFYMPDVYDNEGHDQDDASICIMEKYDSNTAEEFYNNIIFGRVPPFCDYCMEKMLAYTSNINIQGNQGGN